MATKKTTSTAKKAPAKKKIVGVRKNTSTKAKTPKIQIRTNTPKPKKVEAVDGAEVKEEKKAPAKKKVVSVRKGATNSKKAKTTKKSIKKLDVQNTDKINEVGKIEETNDTKKVAKKEAKKLKVKKVNKKPTKSKIEKTVVEQPIKEDKKEKKEKEKVEKISKSDKKKNKAANKKKEKLSVRFRKLSTPFKALIIVSILCSCLLIIEGILLFNHKSFLERNVIYHDTYTGGYLDDNIVALSGSTDFKNGSFNLRTKDNERGKLTVYDDKGNVVLEKVYKKGITTTFNSVVAVSDGYVVVGTGVFSKEELEKEAQEAFIIKYSKDGNIEWEKFYQVLTNTSFNKVIRVDDGYVVVGQSIYANMEMGNHTTGGAIIVKYDKNGNELWHNNHGGTKSGNFNDVVYVNNSYYAVGKDGTDWGNLVKFNNNGEYEWHKNYSYTDEVGFTGIYYTDNNLYVVGSKKVLPEGVKDEDDRSTLNTDALFLKYDMSGNIVFEKTYGGSSYERYNGLTFYHNNFYLVGHTCSNDAGVKVTTDKKDEMTGFIIRYDINANILKKEALGGSNNDNLVDIVTDGISFYVIGYSNSKDGNIIVGHPNGKDYHGRLIKLNNKFQKLFVK